MQIKEIMTPDVEVASPDDTLHTAARMMADLDVGVLPVGKDDRLVGMITDRDIAVRGVAESLDVEEAKVSQIMTHEVRKTPTRRCRYCEMRRFWPKRWDCRANCGG